MLVLISISISLVPCRFCSLTALSTNHLRPSIPGRAYCCNYQSLQPCTLNMLRKHIPLVSLDSAFLALCLASLPSALSLPSSPTGLPWSRSCCYGMKPLFSSLSVLFLSLPTAIFFCLLSLTSPWQPLPLAENLSCGRLSL